MKIVVHPPQSREGLCELRKRMAAVHAEAILRYIANLPCPKQQKLQLLSSIQKSIT